MVQFDLCKTYIKPQMQHAENALRYTITATQDSINYDIIDNVEDAGNKVIDTANDAVDILEDGMHGILKVINSLSKDIKVLLQLLGNVSVFNIFSVFILLVKYIHSSISEIVARYTEKYLGLDYKTALIIASVITLILIIGSILGYLLSVFNVIFTIGRIIYYL